MTHFQIHRFHSVGWKRKRRKRYWPKGKENNCG